MSNQYFFELDGKTVGPLDELTMARLIAERKIRGDTLGWCPGMQDWQPVEQITELQERYGALFRGPKSADQSGKVADAGCQTSGQVAAGHESDKDPASPGAKHAEQQSLKELTPLQVAAYRWMLWLYQPWFGGRPCLLWRYVEKNPRRGLPVAVGTVVIGGFALLLILGGLFSGEDDRSSLQEALPPQGYAQLPQEQMLQPNMFQPMIRAQRQIDNIIDDVYRYNRDSFDRQCETYRRGTYDWYSRSND